MVKKNESNLIVGLDIGTSKVLAIVGEVSVDGEIEIIGVGLSLIHISEPTRQPATSRMPSSA